MQQPEENRRLVLANYAVNIAFLTQLLAFVVSALSFFAPFWYIELNPGIQAGLWGRCDAQLECIWFHERDFAWQQSLPSWHVAAQVMFAIGMVILFVSCCLAIGNVMFRCCKTFSPGTCPIIFGCMIGVAMIFNTFSIGIFGTGAYHVYECSINSWVAHFEWAFFVGIASLFVCLIACLMFVYAGMAIQKAMKGYKAGPYSYAI